MYGRYRILSHRVSPIPAFQHSGAHENLILRRPRTPARQNISPAWVKSNSITHDIQPVTYCRQRPVQRCKRVFYHIPICVKTPTTNERGNMQFRRRIQGWMTELMLWIATMSSKLRSEAFCDVHAATRSFTTVLTLGWLFQ